MPDKPKLLAARVPWSVAVDVPYLEPLIVDERPLSVVFTAAVKRVLKPGEVWEETNELVVVERPDAFRPVREGEEANYHRVRVTFIDGLDCRLIERHDVNEWYTENFDCSDLDTFDFEKYEYAVDMVRAHNQYFLDTGLVRNPRFYEITPSSWAYERAPDDPSMKHYLLLGDEFWFEVLARDFDWEKGQATT
jgi:hypothetical protein